MPLLTLAEFTGLLKKDASFLKITSEEDFVPIELAASDIVSKRTGVVIPDNPADAPSWCKLPMSLICLWVAANRNEGLSQDFRDDTNTKYRAALDILADNKIKSSKGVARSGDIAEKYVW